MSLHGNTLLITLSLLAWTLTVKSYATEGETNTLFHSASPTPAQSLHDQRMAAVLAWLQEDAASAETYKLAAIAGAGRKDIAEWNSKPHQETHLQKTDDLLPPVLDWSNNPVVDGFYKHLQQKILTPDRHFAKGPDGGKSRTEEGWYFATRGDELLELVQAFCHPQSPVAGNPTLVAPILRRLAIFSEYMTPDGPLMADFTTAQNVGDAYLILRTCRPEVLPPSIRTAMDQSIKNNTQAILTKTSSEFDGTSQNDFLFNMESRLVTALAIANRLDPNPAYEKAFHAGLDALQKHILADGATRYDNLQNEAPSYHDNGVISLARAAQISGDARPIELLRQLRWYYPLVVSRGGIMEWSTAPNWHHYWNTDNGAGAAAIMAGILKCPHNQRVANLGFDGDLWAASWWNPQGEAAPWPDGYITYDRNVEGPRGRYGLWSFVGTTRKTISAGDYRGKSTYVGCVVENPPAPGKTKKWAVNAALQDTGMEVRLNASKDDGGEHQGRIAMANEELITVSVVSSNAAVLGAVTKLGANKKQAEPWLTQQAWLFTPERMVGLVRLESLADQQAAGVFGVLYLISGRNHWGERKEIKDLGNGSFGYGELIVTFNEHDFSGFGHEYSDPMSRTTSQTVDQKNPLKAARLLLQDNAAMTGVPSPYKKGSSHFYLVEIRPSSSAPSSISRLNVPGLMGFSVKEKGGDYQVAFNPSADPLKWNIERQGVLHRSGEKYRPEWLREAGPVNSIAPVSSSLGPILLPPGEIAFISNQK